MGAQSSHDHAGHRVRFRQRARDTELKGFQEHEIVELLLMFSQPRLDVNPQADKLIQHFGSLAALLDASAEEIMAVPGIGEASATLLSSLKPLFQIYMRERWRNRRTFCSRGELAHYCMDRFGGWDAERFALVCLNHQNAVIDARVLDAGTTIDVRSNDQKVLDVAMLHRANSIVLVHVLPGGEPAPSARDITSALSLEQSLRMWQVVVADYFILAGEKYVSLWEQGVFQEASNLFLRESPGPVGYAAEHEKDDILPLPDELKKRRPPF